jgi:pimeloyl-ACP methyl ester carboxylesterase
MATVDLFVRESGPPAASAIVFLHGGRMSGWSWTPVVDRMQRYHCLVPDLPQYGQSAGQGPFDMARAAAAVAELIRSRVGAGRAHVIGYSLGGQVGVQLLATAPDLVDRAVLCGTLVNMMPGARPAQILAARFARTAWLRRVVNTRLGARDALIPDADIDDYQADRLLGSDSGLATIVAASVGFTLPESLKAAVPHTLFLSGAKETPFARWSASALARSMPNGIDRVALGMRHDWPLRRPDLFARTVDSWITQSPLPAEIRVPNRRG